MSFPSTLCRDSLPTLKVNSKGRWGLLYLYPGYGLDGLPLDHTHHQRGVVTPARTQTRHARANLVKMESVHSSLSLSLSSLLVRSRWLLAFACVGAFCVVVWWFLTASRTLEVFLGRPHFAVVTRGVGVHVLASFSGPGGSGCPQDRGPPGLCLGRAALSETPCAVPSRGKNCARPAGGA